MLRHLKLLFSSSFRVIKFSSLKWKNNNTRLHEIKPSKFSLISFAIFAVEKKDEIQKTSSASVSFMNCLAFQQRRKCEYKILPGMRDEKEFKWILRDTYRDMLHDNGFYIMRCVYSLKHPLEHQITLTLIQSRESAEVDLPRSHANGSRVSLLCIAVNYLERTLQRCLFKWKRYRSDNGVKWVRDCTARKLSSENFRKILCSTFPPSPHRCCSKETLSFL